MNHGYPQLPDFETNPKKIIKLKSALLLNLSLSNSGVFNQDILKNNNGNDINDDAIKPYPLKRFDALGRGSSSVVYRSILLDTLTICAEKVIVSSDSNKKGMILRELKSLQVATEIKGENCENIVKLLKVVPNPYDGTLSICLEMMDGGSLQDLVNEGGCQDELVLYRILKQMLTGLQYLHSLRLLHRDLKPSNALISSKGVVKLADFGISRFLEEGNSLAESFVGTLDYMAPERMIGQPYSYSSDVWALGLTIHTLALGSYPYTIKEKGFWSLLNAIQNTTITFPPSFSFSQSFCNFLCKSCDKDPLKRPTSSELLILVTDTLDKMEYNIDFAEEKQPEIQIQTIEKTPKKVIKKDIKGSKMKEPILNTKKNTSIKGNNNKTVKIGRAHV
jgi:serine/threonine protein kinase